MIPADDFYEELGKAIRRRREERELKQAELGEHLGLSRTSVTNIESGRQRLLADQLCRVAHILGCDVSDLLPNATKLSTSKTAKSNPDLNSMPAVAKFVERSLTRKASRP
jgi:transcriptional regulator with XRE-family HTH domain